MADNKKRQIISSALGRVKMQNVGEKVDKSKLEVASSSPTVKYPSLYLNAKQMPMMKGAEVKKMVKMMVEGKVTSHSVDDNLRNSRENWNIDIHKAGMMG